MSADGCSVVVVALLAVPTPLGLVESIKQRAELGWVNSLTSRPASRDEYANEGVDACRTGFLNLSHQDAVPPHGIWVRFDPSVIGAVVDIDDLDQPVRMFHRVEEHVLLHSHNLLLCWNKHARNVRSNTMTTVSGNHRGWAVPVEVRKAWVGVVGVKKLDDFSLSCNRLQISRQLVSRHKASRLIGLAFFWTWLLSHRSDSPVDWCGWHLPVVVGLVVLVGVLEVVVVFALVLSTVGGS